MAQLPRSLRGSSSLASSFQTQTTRTCRRVRALLPACPRAAFCATPDARLTGTCALVPPAARQLWPPALASRVLVHLGCRSDVLDALWASAWSARTPSLSAEAVRACIEACSSRVVNLPPVPPPSLVDRARWHDKGAQQRPRAGLVWRAPPPHMRSLSRPSAAGYGLGAPEADSALGEELAVRRRAPPRALMERASGTRPLRPSHAVRVAHASLRRAPLSTQAYTAFAGAAVNLDRAGAAHGINTVEKSVSTLLRFLGYIANVEASPASPTLSSVLDGDALARFVAFSLTVRYVHARRRRRRCRARPAHARSSLPFTPSSLAKGSQTKRRRHGRLISAPAHDARQRQPLGARPCCGGWAAGAPNARARHRFCP